MLGIRLSPRYLDLSYSDRHEKQSPIQIVQDNQDLYLYSQKNLLEQKVSLCFMT